MAIEKNLPQQYKEVELKIPYDQQQLVDYFMSNYDIDEIQYTENGTKMNVTINQIDFNKYNNYII